MATADTRRPLTTPLQREQWRRSTLMNLDTKLDLARKAAETYFAFSAADPEIAQEAMVIAAQEHSRIYMDYLQKLTRLNEELADRMLESSSKALSECQQTSRRKTSRSTRGRSSHPTRGAARRRRRSRAR